EQGTSNQRLGLDGPVREEQKKASFQGMQKEEEGHGGPS
ncbi:unnamed protein product, partial [marine sediment metagenome]